MNTIKTTHLTGLDRVQRYVSEMRSTEKVWLCHYDVIKLLKTRFYYLETKMTAARDGKKVAIDNALHNMSIFVNNAKIWVSGQPQSITNLDRSEFEVLLISPYGAKLLTNIVNFDEVMSELAAAQFAGGQSEDLRTNYFHGFRTHINTLVNVCTKSEPHFFPDGSLRELELT